MRAGGVDHVHALRAGVGHDPGLLAIFDGADPVREHQEANGFHAQVARGREVLDGHVGLGAVGRDPGDRAPALVDLAQVLHGAQTGQHQHRDLGLRRRLTAAATSLGRLTQAEPVVEGRAGQPVAVGHLDDLDAGGVQGVHDHARDVLS